VWFTVGDVWGPTGGVPSPKSNVYVAIGVPSVSVEPAALAVSDEPARMLDGEAVRFAIGGASVTFTVAVAVDARPAVSVTVSVTVNVPVLVYVWVAVAPG
jgi:hypothetical protein